MSTLPEAAAPIRYVLTIRDAIQSLYSGKIPHDDNGLLGVYQQLDKFNAAGPVKIAGIEGHGGALPQYDVLQGRYPLMTAVRMTQQLDPSITQRPLIRGPFGVGLHPLHPEDLSWTLRQMAEAGGAAPQNGHRVVFKLFEAQNRPTEHLDSLRAITQLKKGGYNVACEVAMVISDKPGLDAKHYEGVAKSLLDPDLMNKHKIDTSIVVGFSLKDMIGGVKASQPGHTDNSINAGNLTGIAMNAIQNFSQKTGQQLYLGWHTHEIGNAVDALAEAGKTFASTRKNFPGVTEFQQDVLPGSTNKGIVPNFGFADMEAVTKRHQANGVAPAMSPQQQEIWDDIKSRMTEVARVHRASLINTGNWSKELLEYGQLASGGIPYVEASAIKPYVNHVAQTIKGPDEKPVGEKQAAHILRGLFASINGTLAADLGNAHSVTPAMKLLNDLSIDVMTSLFRGDFLQKRVSQGTDWSKPLVDAESQKEIRAQYGSFRNTQAIAYFCTPMPTPVAPPVLDLLRTKLFDHFFPKTHAELQSLKPGSTASMLKDIELNDETYPGLRAELGSRLLDKPGAAKLLKRAGVDIATANAFVASHIGVNERPINADVKPMRERRVEPAVAALMESTGGPYMVRKGMSRGVNPTVPATFSAMLMRPRPGEGLAQPVADLLGNTPFRPKESWPEFAKRSSGIAIIAPKWPKPNPT